MFLRLFLHPTINSNITKDTVPWISEEWTPSLEPSLNDKKYAPNSTEVISFRDRLNAFYEDGNSAARFSEGLNEKYKVRSSYLLNLCSPSLVYSNNSGLGFRMTSSR